MARRTAAEAAQTREALLDAALLVFAERGFAAAQLEDIAQRAAVTRGALYHHFSGKAALYQATLDERWDTVLGPAVDQLTPPPPPVAPSPAAPFLPSPADDVLWRERKKRSARGRLRAFVSTVLHLVEVDARARALLRMSLSGDHERAWAASGTTTSAATAASPRVPPSTSPRSRLAPGAPNASWADWHPRLVALLGELEPAPDDDDSGATDEPGRHAPRVGVAVEDRAHALIAGLLGHAVWVTLRGPGESSVVALAEVLCDSASLS